MPPSASGIDCSRDARILRKNFLAARNQLLLQQIRSLPVTDRMTRRRGRAVRKHMRKVNHVITDTDFVNFLVRTGGIPTFYPSRLMFCHKFLCVQSCLLAPVLMTFHYQYQSKINGGQRSQSTGEGEKFVHPVFHQKKKERLMGAPVFMHLIVRKILPTLS
jgi:hypothetical protein